MQRASSWATLVAAALAAAMLPLAVQAGSQADPEVIDEAGDQQTAAGTLVVEPQSFDDIDILQAWVAEDFIDFVGEPGPMFSITIETAADIEEDAMFTATFAVEAGPTSLPDSTASGEGFTIAWDGAAASGIPGSDGGVTGSFLRLEIPLPSVGAVGGDLLTNLTITSSRSDAGTVMPPVTQDDESGSDEAGPGTAYTFFREPPVEDVEIVVIGGYFLAGGERNDFTGDRVTVHDPGQAIEVDFRVTNTGTDEARFLIDGRGTGVLPLTATEPDLAGAGASDETVSGLVVELAPGESHADTWTIQLDDPDGNASFAVIVALADRVEEAVLAIVVDVPAASLEREVYPAGLDFMTPAAEATGLDDEFGDHAELFLLAVLVLLFFILVFLALALRRPLPIAVAHAAPPIEPAKAFASHVTGDRAEQGVAHAAPPSAAPSLATGGALADQPEGIELGVLHTPSAPDIGDKVTTTAIVRNMRKGLRKLRVTLLVDGKRKVEEEIELMPRGTREVRLPWLAGPGKNVASVEVTEI